MSILIDSSVIETLKELGDDEFFLELVDLFTSQSTTLVSEIVLAVKEKDSVKLSQSAHKFKGSCLNLGATSLGDLCKKLELKGKSGDLSETEELASKLEPLYLETLDELNKYK